MLDNMTASGGDREAPPLLSDLKLVRSPHNDNDFVRPLLLPGRLASATFGFFDDKAILRQLSQHRLIEMTMDDFSFRFVADLDHNGKPETYRTGWYQLPDRDDGQFLAVFEDGTLRDVWAADSMEPLTISWRSGKPIVFPCNCPTSAPIVYARGKLHMRMTSE